MFFFRGDGEIVVSEEVVDRGAGGTEFGEDGVERGEIAVDGVSEVDDEGEADIIGDLTLNGVTREITLDTEMLGHGKDPWGGYRMGFEAETEFNLDDFGISYEKIGKVSREVQLIISVEGIRQ